MLTSTLRDIYLVDELQLGQRLNESLQSSNHADFALMLSMLSHDMTDLNIGSDKAAAYEELSNAQLRKKFNLQEPVKKYAENEDFVRGADMSSMLHIQGMRAVSLQTCIKSEPLCAFRHDIAPEVFSGLTPLKQEKLRRQFSGLENETEPLHERGEGFMVLDEIKGAKSLISYKV